MAPVYAHLVGECTKQILADIAQGGAGKLNGISHTANDTLDKADLDNMRQNLAAWVTMVYLTANSTISFGPVESL